ncbi:MAG: enoyl-CoA hydratase/isomerase family protein [Dehalococcoidia bacterium]
MSNFETILYEKKGGIAYITLNRPQALNVYNIQMRDELYQVFGTLYDDEDVRVVILKGAGEKAFCAGADLSEFLTAPSPIVARQVRWERDIWGVFLNVPQPVIAALHGYVLGSGIEMALCSDLRLASENVQFGLPEVALGIIPAAGATQTLPRTVGRAKSLDMLLTGRWIGAEEAYKAGMVNQVTPGDKLLSATETKAKQIASCNPMAVRYVKRALHRGASMPLADGLRMERTLSSLVLRASNKDMK